MFVFKKKILSFVVCRRSFAVTTLVLGNVGTNECNWKCCCVLKEVRFLCESSLLCMYVEVVCWWDAGGRDCRRGRRTKRSLAVLQAAASFLLLFGSEPINSTKELDRQPLASSSSF